MANVRVDIPVFRRFAQAVEQGLRSQGGGGVATALKQWGVLYRSAMKERFVEYSRGGGDWPKLKASTIRGRRRGRGRRVTTRRPGQRRSTRTVAAGQVAILIDTATLIGGLDPMFQPSKGAIERPIKDGLTVGYGGSAGHPRGRMTIAAIANIHHGGTATIPARPIIVPPSPPVAQQMADLMNVGLAKDWAASKGVG